MEEIVCFYYTITFLLHFPFYIAAIFRLSKFSCCLRNKINAICSFLKTPNKTEQDGLTNKCIS